eukprot:110923-Pyramimonas_sp.AAC.2
MPLGSLNAQLSEVREKARAEFRHHAFHAQTLHSGRPRGRWEYLALAVIGAGVAWRYYGIK